MKKFEYRIVNLGKEIQKIRETAPRQSEGDEVLMIEIMNEFGSDGWRIMNVTNRNELYLEREIE